MPESTPNMLLFVCDDYRWDLLSGLGHAEIETPHLDRFMAGGTTFTRCAMPGSLTGAVCIPARAMIHTGRDLFKLEGCGETIPSGHTLLGEWLGAAGYTCFHTGKWHNGRESFARSFNAGGSIFFGGMGDQWNMPFYDFDPTGEYGGRIPYVLDPLHEKEVRWREGDRTTDGQHATEVFTDEAIRFLGGEQSREKPFFLSVALTAPHDPRTAPERFHEMYPPDRVSLPPNFLAQHPHDTGALTGRDEMLATLPRDPEETRRHIADYHAMIAHVDAAFGRLMDALEASGLREDTLVVFTADHGLAVGQHGLLGKQCVYEHSIRIPLILSGPGIAAGVRCDALVRQHHLFATLADLLGREPPGSVTGKSLRTVAEEGHPGELELYLAYGDSVRGLIRDDWKIIEYRRAGYAATQLFSLSEDPQECFDRALDPTCSERRQALRARLEEAGRTNGDRGFPEGERFWGHW